ncbi:unnamed protein product [Auanema sp. JU1783]|nr:unnamed protein product [Auanema sp. JU1783]
MPKTPRKDTTMEDDTDSDILKSPDKKKQKKEVSFQDSDIEDEEHVEVDETGINPTEMLKHVEGFMEYLRANNKTESAYRTMLAKLTDEYFSSTGEDRSFDIETFVKTYRKYYAAAFKKITIDSSLKCVKDYLESNECIVHYPDFPRAPPSVLTLYCRKNNLNFQFGKMAEIRATISNDEAGKSECEHELSQLEAKYLRDLENFRERKESEFSAKQLDFLDKKIKSMKKKLLGPPVRNTPKTPKGATRATTRAKKTAFDLFLATKKDKYTDLDEESRIKKLQKKFEKLDEDKKDIFEKLALM